MKMSTVLKKHGVNLKSGTILRGKWNNHTYTIIRKIGEGVVGSVYLTQRNGQSLALKISKQNSSITMEVNVLKALQMVQGRRLGPLLMDVDDWEARDGNSYSFYVMEYVRGENIATFIRRKGPEWIGAFLFQLLEQLNTLHDRGFVFGDLKIDHLIVEPSPPNLRLIDFGGATRIGRAIKEFTEFYDRGYWKLGSRRAEPSYDLFSLAMVFIHLFHPQEFPRGENPQKTLLTKLRETTALSLYEPVFKKALLGRYSSGQAMLRDLHQILYRQQRKARNYQNQSPRGLKPFLIEIGIFSLFITLFAILAYFLPF